MSDVCGEMDQSIGITIRTWGIPDPFSRKKDLIVGLLPLRPLTKLAPPFFFYLTQLVVPDMGFFLWHGL